MGKRMVAVQITEKILILVKKKQTEYYLLNLRIVIFIYCYSLHRITVIRILNNYHIRKYISNKYK